ncbi:MAG: hypothetical protein AAFN81_24695 [Bacteroidota bacterium]
MNYKMTFTLLAFSLLFCATPTSAQVEVKWEKEMPGNILWQQVTTLGQLIVETDAGLIGVDTETGETKWTQNGLANLPQGAFVELPDSPFFPRFQVQNYPLREKKNHSD